MSEFLLIDRCDDAPPAEVESPLAPNNPGPISGMTRRLRDRAGRGGAGRLDRDTIAALRDSARTGAALESVAPIATAAPAAVGTDSGAARGGFGTLAFITILFLALRAA